MKKLTLLIALVLTMWGAGQAEAKLILGDTNDTLEVVTASAVSTINVYASWADITSTTITPGMTNSLVTTATTTTAVAAPGASTQRQVKMLTIYNSHASSSNAISVQVYDGTNRAVLIKYTLMAGETLSWSEDENFRAMDASGNVKVLLSLKTPNGDALTDDTNDAIRTSAVTITQVGGPAAHDSANSQNPIITGCHATASLAGETLVTAGDAVRCYAGRDGALIARMDASLEDITYAVVTATTGANTSLVAAAGAGIKTCIKHVIVNGIGTTSSNYALLTDGSGGTTKADLVYPSGTAATYVFPLPVCSTANTAWYVDSQGSETLRVTVGYFKSQE